MAASKAFPKKAQVRATASTTPAERRARDTRQHIIDVSLRFMSAHGSDKLTMGDVARLAKLSRASLYNHFASREALVEAAEMSLQDSFFQNLTAEIIKHQRLDERAAAMAIFIRETWIKQRHTPWFGFLSSLDKARLIIAKAPRHIDDLGDFVAPYVRDAQERSEIRKDLDVARTSRWIGQIVFSFAFSPADPKMNESKYIMRLFEQHLMPGLR